MDLSNTSSSVDKSATGFIPKEGFSKKAEDERCVRQKIWKSSIAVVSQYFCEDCQKQFSNYISYLQHFKSQTHYKRLRKLRDFEEIYPHLIAQSGLTPKIENLKENVTQMEQVAVQDISSVNLTDELCAERRTDPKLEDVGQGDYIKLNEPSELFVGNSSNHTEDKLEVICAGSHVHTVGSYTGETGEFEDVSLNIETSEQLDDHLSYSTDSSSIEVLYKDDLSLNDQDDNKEKEWFFLKWFYTQEDNH
ncbi:uncharacterized protein LOC143249309 [Tachypleus tridentatus]|uniref:uncharacterized protein LOC143249309 n=1 Tax=Tachypleus tridentatus TaxID=6853 RepID=UPI003FD02521